MSSARAISQVLALRFRPCSDALPAKRLRGRPEDDFRGHAARAIQRWMPTSVPLRRQRAAGGLEPPPRGLVGWKSKPVVPWRRGKAPDQNPGTGEMVEQVYAIAGFEQAEQ